MNVLPRLGLAALLSATAGLPAGCSYLFVTAPPPHHEKLYDVDCTTGNVLPVVDSVVGTVYGIAAVSAIADNERSGTIAAAAVAAAVFGASAVLGFGRTQDCRAARAKLAVRLEGLRREDPRGPVGAPGFVADPWLDPSFAAPSTAAPRPTDAWGAPQGRSAPDATVAPPSDRPAPSPSPAVVPTVPEIEDRSTPHPKED